MRKIIVLGVAILLAAFYALLAIEPRRENPFATPTHPTFSTLQDTRGTRLLLDFEKDLAGLNVSNATASLVTHDRTPDHPHSLEVACHFSGQVGPKDDVLIALPRQMDLADIGTLLVDVQVRGRGPGSNSVQTLFSIRTIENLWYQRDFTGFLPRGQWVTLSADFSGNSDDWLPVGHRVPWDAETRQSIDTFTIRFYNKNSAQVRLYLGSIRYRPASGPVESTQIASLYAESSQVPLYGKYEVSFRLTRPYQNPFDPDEVDVQGTFVSPSGRVLNVPAFFYQNYERRMENGQETLSAFGPKLWKIRFCPTEIGTHRYRIRVRDTSTTLSPELSFETVPSQSPGFVRVSKTDPRFFEYENGQFFYPIGMNAVSPWDSGYNVDYTRPLPRGKGTYAFDEYLEKLGTNGGNWIRMWMAEWWLALEWSRGHGPYLGLGRYSLENAWRLDHILEQAERFGVKIDLTLINHVQFNTAYHWNVNPYNRSNPGTPGPCRNLEEFYTGEEARTLFKKRLRYIVARWGYSTSIFAWDLWSEAEFAPTWRTTLSPSGVRWHQEMFSTLKQLDPWGHLTSTHFNNPGASPATWRLPEMDFVHATLWPSGWGAPTRLEVATVLYDRECSRYGKPYLGGEFGGHWGGSAPRVMERDLHSGLWRTLTLNAGGTPMFWWWNFLHNRDLYFEFRSLARFLKGEDLRGPERVSRTEQASAKDATLEAHSFGDSAWRILWIADPLVVWHVCDDPRTISDATITVSDLQPGSFSVEVWDIASGQPIAMLHQTTQDGRIVFPLPQFQRDLACKVKLIDANQ